MQALMGAAIDGGMARGGQHGRSFKGGLNGAGDTSSGGAGRLHPTDPRPEQVLQTPHMPCVRECVLRARVLYLVSCTLYFVYCTLYFVSFVYGRFQPCPQHYAGVLVALFTPPPRHPPPPPSLPNGPLCLVSQRPLRCTLRLLKALFLLFRSLRRRRPLPVG